MSARVPKQFVLVTIYNGLKPLSTKRTKQNSSGRTSTAESVHGRHGILSAEIVPNTGFG